MIEAVANESVKKVAKFAPQDPGKLSLRIDRAPVLQTGTGTRYSPVTSP